MNKKFCDIEDVRRVLLSHMVKREIGPADIGRIIGVSRNTVNDFISGKKDPTFVTQAKIINYLKKISREKMVDDIDTDVVA